jgi:hypothetical protein
MGNFIPETMSPKAILLATSEKRTIDVQSELESQTRFVGVLIPANLTSPAVSKATMSQHPLQTSS